MKKRALILVVLIVVVFFGFRSCANRAERNSGVIRISGNIEITDVELSFKAPGRVQERCVSEGQPVKAGDVVALLDSVELMQMVAQADATLAVAKAEAARAKLEFARQKELHDKHVVSDREYEIAEAANAAASAAGKQAEAALALAQTRLGYATLTSPVDGTVLSEHIESGEYVVPGTPVVTIGNLSVVWLRGYISETDLGRVKVGQAVKVKTDTYPGKVYDGRVSFIASDAEFTPRSVQTQKERVKLVYRIKVDIPNPAMELKPGMPADAEIALNGR